MNDSTIMETGKKEMKQFILKEKKVVKVILDDDEDDSCKNERSITNFTNQVNTPPDSYHETFEEDTTRSSRLKKPTNIGNKSTASLFQ